MATLDVRADLAAGKEPFERIMSAAKGLAPSEPLTIVAPFEPVPLYTVLGGMGFSHETARLPDGGWQVTFSKKATGSGAGAGEIAGRAWKR